MHIGLIKIVKIRPNQFGLQDGCDKKDSSRAGDNKNTLDDVKAKRVLRRTTKTPGKCEFEAGYQSYITLN